MTFHANTQVLTFLVFDISSKLSPLEKKREKNIILSSAELAERVIKVNIIFVHGYPKEMVGVGDYNDYLLLLFVKQKLYNTIFEPAHEKRILITKATIKDSGKPVHRSSLAISAFAISGHVAETLRRLQAKNACL